MNQAGARRAVLQKKYNRFFTRRAEMTPQAQPPLTRIVYEVVLQKSIPTQVRQLILYI